MTKTKNIILSLSNISKSFGKTVALKNVSVDFEEGKVTSIYGPNGTGKSTMIKIIVGEERTDSGQILIKGKIVKFNNYFDALKNGISYVPQDFGLLNNLSVMENIGILYNQFHNKLTFSETQLTKFVNQNKKSNLLFPDLNRKVEDLTTFEKQMLATHKALLLNSEIIIFDESTTNLNKKDFKNFKNVINSLRDKGKTIIFISHKIDEVFEISDDIVVLKEGNVLDKGNINKISKAEIIGHYNLKIENETFNNKQNNVIAKIKLDDFDKSEIEIKKGEIIAIDTIDTRIKQNIGYKLFDKIKKIKNLKIGIVPSSRDEEAIFPNMSVKDNLLINVYKKFTLNNDEIVKKTINEIAYELKLVFRDWEQNINELSGGNKQKIVFGRWILSDFDILILIEPTSGIDIETKNILHNKILGLKNEGKSFLLITSDEGEQNILTDRLIYLNLAETYDKVS